MSESSLSLEDFKPHAGLISMGFGGAVVSPGDCAAISLLTLIGPCNAAAALCPPKVRLSA